MIGYFFKAVESDPSPADISLNITWVLSGYPLHSSKSFSTEKAYVNHLKSKKHLEAQRAFDNRSDINQDELINNRMNRKLERDEAERQRQKQIEEELAEEDDDDEIEEVDSDEWDEDEEGKSNNLILSSIEQVCKLSQNFIFPNL